MIMHSFYASSSSTPLVEPKAVPVNVDLDPLPLTTCAKKIKFDVFREKSRNIPVNITCT